MDTELLAFYILSLIIVVAPGPNVIYVVSNSLRYGATAGLISTLGISIGSVGLVLAASFGLSFLLAVFPTAIIAVQIVGGCYAIYLAIKLWPRGLLDITEQRILAKESYRKIFKNGCIASILDPKDILFFTAFVPSFIPRGTEGASYQAYFIFLAFSYICIGFVTKYGFAVSAGYTKKTLQSASAVFVNYLSSSILLFLGMSIIGRHLEMLVL